MTLSNIFFGKKVVQQAYLNNALIYQSKGWETLPSTCTEVWTKDFGALGVIDTKIISQCVTDSNNNIYVLSNNDLFKLNSEGSFIWAQTIKGIKYVSIDSNNDVYIALTIYDYNSNPYIYIAKLDDNGNIQKEFKANGNIANYATNFALDDKYFYISVNYNTNYNKYFNKIDREGKIVDQISLQLNNSTLVVADDSFLYAGLGSNLIKIDKNNISNYTVEYKIPNDYSILNIILDELGNVIVIDTTGAVYKYNFENNASIKYRERAITSNLSFTLDYQKNLYFTSDGSNGTDNAMYLIKYSSDGTLIFETKILTDQNDSIFYGKLHVDSNGNIYYLYNKYNSGSGYSLTIKKLINIEKKGN